MRPSENPFRSGRIDSLSYVATGVSLDDVMRRLETNGFRGCVLGPHGSGKTTLCEALARRFDGSGRRAAWVVQRADNRQLSWRELGDAVQRTGRDGVLFLDGADLLSVSRWWWLRWVSRRCGGLVVTSHEKELLPVAVRTTTSAALLAKLMRTLLDEAGLGVDEAKVDRLAQDLFERHGGNVREAMREAYDWWAKENAQFKYSMSKRC